MKNIEILALGVRVVGIAFILEIVQFLAYAYNAIQQWMFSNPGEGIMLWLISYGVLVSVMMLLCFLLIKFPITISRLLLPKDESNEVVFDGSINDLITVAFTVMGVYILSWAIPDFIYNASMLVHIQSEGVVDLYDDKARAEYMIQEVVTTIEIGVGLFLCLKAEGLNALLLKLRSLGSS